MKLLCKTICFSEEGIVSRRKARDWERVLEDASECPERIVRASGMKRTLKAKINPWGYVCLREYNWDLKRRLEMLVRKSRGERIWKYSPLLLSNGILVQKPLLFFERRCLGILMKTWLATQWIEEKTDLGSLAMDMNFRASSQFKSLVEEGTVIIAKLHNMGFLHGDLKWSNFLRILENRPRLLLSDLDGIRKSRSSVLRAKDFARFVLSCYQYGLGDDFARFIVKAYLDASRNESRLLEGKLQKYISLRKERYLNKPLVPQ